MNTINKTLIVSSPVNATISIRIDKEQFIELDLVQAINVELTESRKPIYGFENQNYHSVLAGKRIVSGTIIIKRYSFDSIIAKIKAKQTDTLKESIIEEIKNKVKTVYELLDNKLDEIKLETHYPGNNQTSYNEDYLIQQKNKFGAETVIKEISERTETINNVSDLKISNLFDLAEKYEISLKLNTDGIPLIIKDINFISKDTSIEINREDIDDRYQFFGNLI